MWLEPPTRAKMKQRRGTRDHCWWTPSSRRSRKKNCQQTCFATWSRNLLALACCEITHQVKYFCLFAEILELLLSKDLFFGSSRFFIVTWNGPALISAAPVVWRGKGEGINFTNLEAYLDLTNVLLWFLFFQLWRGDTSASSKVDWDWDRPWRYKLFVTCYRNKSANALAIVQTIPE